MSPFREKQILLRAGIKYGRIVPFVGKGPILDIGSGNAGVAKLLQNDGLQVIALDVKNRSRFPDIQPLIYDGQRLPFEDQSFPTVMLLTVLHHCDNPGQIVHEAARVCSNTLLVMEDIYGNRCQKALTHFSDSLVNWEFKGHPHSNKSDREWQSLFKKNGLFIDAVIYYRFALVFKQVLYVLKKRKGQSQ